VPGHGALRQTSRGSVPTTGTVRRGSSADTDRDRFSVTSWRPRGSGIGSSNRRCQPSLLAIWPEPFSAGAADRRRWRRCSEGAVRQPRHRRMHAVPAMADRGASRRPSQCPRTTKRNKSLRPLLVNLLEQALLPPLGVARRQREGLFDIAKLPEPSRRFGITVGMPAPSQRGLRGDGRSDI
jgi:hypothetical protein